MNLHIGPDPKKPNLAARLRQAKPTMLRASLLGLCCGLMIVGLMENAKRFADPDGMHGQDRLAAQVFQVSQSDMPTADTRENRIDMLAVRIGTDG